MIADAEFNALMPNQNCNAVKPVLVIFGGKENQRKKQCLFSSTIKFRDLSFLEGSNISFIVTQYHARWEMRREKK